ncbi:DUF3079 domain-containing protein [Micromonospora sp. NPDC048894]|uniref:DUF3079 domain-containing protein n=1 Tax=unclassified Micromonospora TaxID=2617518 RepID=UPI0033EAC4DC
MAGAGHHRGARRRRGLLGGPTVRPQRPLTIPTPARPGHGLVASDRRPTSPRLPTSPRHPGRMPWGGDRLCAAERYRCEVDTATSAQGSRTRHSPGRPVSAPGRG